MAYGPTGGLGLRGSTSPASQWNCVVVEIVKLVEYRSQGFAVDCFTDWHQFNVAEYCLSLTDCHSKCHAPQCHAPQCHAPHSRTSQHCHWCSWSAWMWHGHVITFVLRFVSQELVDSWQKDVSGEWRWRMWHSRRHVGGFSVTRLCNWCRCHDNVNSLTFYCCESCMQKLLFILISTSHRHSMLTFCFPSNMCLCQLRLQMLSWKFQKRSDHISPVLWSQ